jgi:hypothetical protein
MDTRARLTAAFAPQVARFIGASSPKEVVITRNATEAINLVACTWGQANIRQGDEVSCDQSTHVPQSHAGSPGLPSFPSSHAAPAFIVPTQLQATPAPSLFLPLARAHR